MDKSNGNSKTIKIEDVEHPDLSGFFKIIPVSNSDLADDQEAAIKRLNHYLKNVETSVQPQDEQVFELQQNYVARLRSIANGIRDKQQSGHDLLVRLGTAFGEYKSLPEQLHYIRSVGADLHPKKDPRTLKLNPLDVDASEELRALYLEIQKTLTVVDVVLSRREGDLSKKSSFDHKDQQRHLSLLRREYLQRLKEIADYAWLHRDATAYGTQKLTLFQEAFVSREADYVKNKHIQSLGLRAALLLVPLTALYLFFTSGGTSLTASDNIKIWTGFLALAAGACIGTWLSFSLRRTSIGFTDLVLLEPDRVNPTSRLIYVVLLTCILGLLLELGMVPLQIAGVKITPSTGFMVAFLIGILSGISERSLAGFVSGKASSLMKSLEGKAMDEKNGK